MKIGVLTHYYKSTNYGGNLQAYALVSCLREKGYDAEQICYHRINDFLSGNKIKKRSTVVQIIIYFINIFRKYNQNKRNSAIQKFNLRSIHHSNKIYTKTDLAELGNSYDVFISGSDQVWHPMAVCDAYLLNFPTNAKRISYAASFSTDQLSDCVIKYYRPCLLEYCAISVREKRAIELVRMISGQEAQLVIDPTLLLNVNDWGKIIEEKKIKKPYLFCYYLGTDPIHREKALQIAKQKCLKIVTLPCLTSKNKADKGFGDYRLYSVSPGQLLYLIKNAQCVLTDSFHASVFSILYHKPFMVFDRLVDGKDGGMGSRIDTLLGTFHLEQCRGDIHAPGGTPMEGDWEQVEAILAEERKKSLAFLKHALDME